MTFSTHLVCNLPRATYRQLYSLNLRSGGYCREQLVNAYRRKHVYSYAVLAREGPRVLGWALLYQRMHKSRSFSHYDLGFYVRHAHRKQGIAGALFSRVDALMEEHGVKGRAYASTDAASRAFYSRHTSPRVHVTISNRRRKTTATSPLSHTTNHANAN